MPVSPARKPIRHQAWPLRRQASSRRHGDCASRAVRRAAAARSVAGALGFGEGRGHEGVGRRLARGRREPRLLALDQGGVERGIGERRRGDQPAEELDVVGDADDPVRRQRRLHLRQRRGPVGAMDDQLGDHRVVERGDRVALLDAGVDAHALAFRRRDEMHELAGGRQEAAVGILGVDPRLDRMAGDRELALAAAAAARRRRRAAATRPGRAR